MIDSRTLDALLAQADVSPRRRQHLNLHRSHAEPSQRFLNAVHADSYVRPHRHMSDPKPETLAAVSGAFALVTFAEHGAIHTIVPFASERHWRRGKPFGAVVDPETWHTILALTDTAVLLEVKSGPFDPERPKDPAPWAPDEADAVAGQAYLATLRQIALASGTVADQISLSPRP